MYLVPISVPHGFRQGDLVPHGLRARVAYHASWFSSHPGTAPVSAKAAMMGDW
jgi:hypothetical protein